MNLAGLLLTLAPSPPPHLRKTVCSSADFYCRKDQRGANDWMAPSALGGAVGVAGPQCRGRGWELLSWVGSELSGCFAAWWDFRLLSLSSSSSRGGSWERALLQALPGSPLPLPLAEHHAGLPGIRCLGSPSGANEHNARQTRLGQGSAVDLAAGAGVVLSSWH